MSNTDTPRTDKTAFRADIDAMPRYAVHADFARTLERETAQLAARIAELERELAERTNQFKAVGLYCDRLTNDILAQTNRAESAEAQLATAKEQLRRSEERVKELGESLRDVLFAAQNADETGYVTDVGFIDIDAIYNKAHALLKANTCPDPSCEEGVIDSGGVTPQGAGIDVPCPNCAADRSAMATKEGSSK